jgi:predicted amidophosphoribosyltransferase
LGINPIRLYGPWNEGFALDTHTLASTYVGDNEYGHPMYDTQHSPMGALIYLLKYRDDYSKLADIIRLAAPFVNSWNALNDVDLVLPVPPSRMNRTYQPAHVIAREIARLIGANYSGGIMNKASPTESKGLSSADKQQLQGTITQTVPATREHNILLVDDLCDKGATLTECVRVLRQDSKIKKIFVLTMTKTRKG